jgi:HD-GYP domain-containing protein (c-di-GMP phosphodiesterase class II)
MQTIPEEVLNSPKLTPEEFQLLRQHPLESRKIVETFGGEFSWIGAVVIQIHERHDGSGYPAGIKGEDIHEFARIIGLTDVYEAMAHPRADRAARVIYYALSEIIDVHNKFFDPNLIKALIHIVSIFPLGSLVQLNNGAIGRVIGANKLYPTRPLLELLLNPKGTPIQSTTFLNLEDEPMLTIADPAIDESVLENLE